MVVKRVPLVGRNLLLQQHEKHADSDKKLLKVPDLICNRVISRMVRDPGVKEKDKRPNNEADDDGNLAQAFARQAELKQNSRSEINDKQDKVGCVAKRSRRSEDPDRNPRAELNKQKPPSLAEAPGPGDCKCTSCTNQEAERGSGMIHT